MAAVIYEYTPQQTRVVQLHNYARSSLMNAKYYARHTELLKRINVLADIIVALATSGSFAGLAIWQTGIGKNAFTALLAFSVLTSTLRPVLRIADKIDRYSKLHYGYLELYYRIEGLIDSMQVAGHITEEHKTLAVDLADRFRALELEGDAYQNPKKLLKYQDEVEKSLPASQLWLPAE